MKKRYLRMNREFTMLLPCDLNSGGGYITGQHEAVSYVCYMINILLEKFIHSRKVTSKILISDRGSPHQEKLDY